METFLACGQGLDGFGKFTGDVADQSKLGTFLERGVLSRRCGFRLGLALGLRVVGGSASIREERNLLVLGKARNRDLGRTKTVDPRDIRAGEQTNRQGAA